MRHSSIHFKPGPWLRHAGALRRVGHIAAHLGNVAHRLVAHDLPGLAPTVLAGETVEVRAKDAGGRDLDQDVVGAGVRGRDPSTFRTHGACMTSAFMSLVPLRGGSTLWLCHVLLDILGASTVMTLESSRPAIP